MPIMHVVRTVCAEAGEIDGRHAVIREGDAVAGIGVLLGADTVARFAQNARDVVQGIIRGKGDEVVRAEGRRGDVEIEHGDAVLEFVRVCLDICLRAKQPLFF